MPIKIDNRRFKAAHEAFCKYMQEAEAGGGVPFTNFQHPQLVIEEIEYKRVAYGKAKDALCLHKWGQWVKQMPEAIIDATKKACAPSVSFNLLEHRYGWQHSSEAALYRVKSEVQVAGLAWQLNNFFDGGASSQDAFGPRFDAFADYLRDNSLSCNWRFLAYLAFLLNPDLYFPITPTQFDHLLKHYGINETIAGYVSWERYSLLLALAEILKLKLAVYGPANALEIQSYMWIVASLPPNQRASNNPVSETPDFEAEFASRVRKAEERERTGLQGEQFVYDQERARLKKSGRPDLAKRVELVAWSDDNAGFDILSFDPGGNELHIEVKTTAQSPDDDRGFWLSENERIQAEQDPRWCIYRVWAIASSPRFKNLGNVVTHPSAEWRLCVSTWLVEHMMVSD